MIQYNYMKKLLWCILPLVLLACNSKRNIKSQYPNGMVYEDYFESKQHPGQKKLIIKKDYWMGKEFYTIRKKE